MRSVEIIVAILIGLFIAGAFYAGLSTDFGAFTSGLNNIINTLQGRNAQGNVVGYPSGGPTVKVSTIQG